jgi:putative phosphoesterase
MHRLKDGDHMKILILSDSHSTMSFMRRCVESVLPDAIVHLGDHFDDGEALREEYAHISFYQVPGNCDRYRCPPGQPEILNATIGGVPIYMTHGHRHSVKAYLGALLKDARTCGAQAVLYGHTHVADCRREEDGLWVVNPGSCGYYGGSAAVMEVGSGRIVSCRLITDEDLVTPW